MAINKDFLVKNGLQVGGNTQLTGSLTASGLSYPVSDGDQYMAMVTDGNGNLSFNNVDTVESDVTNNTGSLIPKGTPVYQTGAAGNTLTIAPSDASNAATMPAIGVAASDIADGDTGRVIHFGYIKGVDTSAFSEGDRIYVADGGGYQVGRPTGEGNTVQFLGVVTKVHATNGSGVVFGGGRSMDVPNLDDGNIFIGNSLNTAETATLDTSIVPENSNLYFTDARAKSAIEASTHLTIDGGTLYIDTDSNRIGINDTSPQQALDVTGAIAIGGTTVIDSGGEVVTAQLKNSGVTAGSYGSASLVPIITVDSKGRITSASTTSVAGVSNFTFNSTTDVLTISTADGGSYTSDISNITVGGSMDGPLANLTVKYQSTAPTSPSQGQIYFDSLNQLLMIYTGSSWVQTIPSSSGGGGTSGVTDAVATFQKYTYTLSSTTNAVSGASEQVVDAGDFTIGKSYQIRTVGDTDFTAIGASANTVGTVFVATGVGEGTGDAYTYLAYSTAGAQNVEVFVNGVKQVEGASNDYVATTGTAVTFTYNIPSGSVVDVQIYELLTQDAFYLKADTYTKTETNSQISNAVSAYLPLTGGTLTGALSGTNATFSGDLTADTDTLYVDSTNNQVGIGTTSITGGRKLHVFDSGDAIIRVETTTVGGDGRLELVGDNTGVSQIRFGDQDVVNVGLLTYTHSNNSMAFNTNSGTRMTITSSGSVGIGTDTPDSELEVSGTGNQQIKVTRTDDGVETVMLSQAGEGWIGTASNHPLKFGTNYTYDMYLSTAGELGINRVPQSGVMLDIDSNDVSNVLTRFTGTNSGGTVYSVIANDGTAANGTATGLEFRAKTSTSERQQLYILNSWTDSDDGTRESLTKFYTAGAGAQQLPLALQGTRVAINDVPSGFSSGDLYVQQSADTADYGISILNNTRGRSMRLWCDSTDSYIYSGGDGSAELHLNGATGTSTVAGTLNVDGKLKVPTASSDPTSGLATGQVYFNTSNSALKVYDGTEWLDVGGNLLRVSTFDIFEDSSTIALWQMDGNGLDTGGNYDFGGNTGSANFTTGQFGQAFNGDGTNSLYTNSSGTAPSGAYSVSFWYNSSTTGQGNKRLVCVKGTSTASGWNNYNGSLGFYLGNGTTSTASVTRVAQIPDSAVNDGQWHHLVYTVTTGGTGATWKIYLDGAEYNNPVSGEGRSFNNGSTVAVCTYDSGTNYNTIGKVDQLRIFNRVLTANEVSRLTSVV